MTVVTPGSAATTTVADRTTPARATDQLADPVDWFDGTLRAWRRQSWCRAVAVLAMLGALGDAFTTSALPHVPGVHEANPVSAAGQATLGSVPLFMLVATVPLVITFLILANRPTSAYTWFLWSAVASVGGVKLCVTFSNLVVLGVAVST